MSLGNNHQDLIYYTIETTSNGKIDLTNAYSNASDASNASNTSDDVKSDKDYDSATATKDGTFTQAAAGATYHRKQTDIESVQQFVALKGLPTYANMENIIGLMPAAMIQNSKSKDSNAPVSSHAHRKSHKMRAMTMGPAGWAAMKKNKQDVMSNGRNGADAVLQHKVNIVSNEAFGLLVWHFLQNLCLQLRYDVKVLLFKNEKENSAQYQKCLEKLAVDTFNYSNFEDYKNGDGSKNKDEYYIKVEFLPKGKGSLFFSNALVEKLFESDETDKNANNVEVKLFLYLFIILMFLFSFSLSFALYHILDKCGRFIA